MTLSGDTSLVEITASSALDEVKWQPPFLTPEDWWFFHRVDLDDYQRGYSSNPDTLELTTLDQMSDLDLMHSPLQLIAHSIEHRQVISERFIKIVENPTFLTLPKKYKQKYYYLLIGVNCQKMCSIN